MRYIISSALASLTLSFPALAEIPKVVTDIHPVNALVSQVMGDLGSPTLLLERGASEHDFQLRPSQAADLANADLVVWIGPELTPWLDRALDGIGEGSARLALLGLPGTETRAYSKDGAHHDGEHRADEPAQDHGHDDQGQDDHSHSDHGHDETASDGDSDHDHAHDGIDPHAWLDPANAQVWLSAIAAELSRLDAGNAAIYAANADAAITRLAALDAEVAQTLAPAQGKPLIVYHDAYGYFAAHYGLSIFGSVALGDASAPGAARLSDLRAGIDAGTPLCLFPEAQHDASLITQLADGTGAKIGAALDPNGSTLDPGPDGYATLLRTLAQSIADCAGQP